MLHEYRVLHFRLGSSSRDLAPLFRDLKGSNIPYGIYDYELVPAPGDTSNERVSGSIPVYRSQVHVTNVLETSDSLGHRAQVQVAGMLLPHPKGNERVWITLQNVYGRYRDESTVDTRGSFQLNYIWGNNVIIVCAGPQVLLTAPLNVRPGEIVNYLRVDLNTGKLTAEFQRP